MQIQIITFRLAGMTEAELAKISEEVFLPTLLRTPGLLSKVFLHDAATRTYGGVYTWRDPQAMVDYTQTDFFKAFASNPSFADMTSRSFDLVEEPTRLMNGIPAPVATR